MQQKPCAGERSSYRFLLSVVLAFSTIANAQIADSLRASNELPDAPDAVAQQTIGGDAQASLTEANKEVPLSRQQPQRILGIMPNFRAVSAGAVLPPSTPKEAFKVATQNSFDYSSFFFVGLTSMIAEGENAHPELGKGIGGFWAYSGRGFVDKTDGNYWVIFALPTVFHEDERYYAMGHVPIWKRAFYSSTRIFITPDYHGHNTINASELLGRAAAQGVSTTYYPASANTAGALRSKYGYALMRVQQRILSANSGRISRCMLCAGILRQRL